MKKFYLHYLFYISLLNFAFIFSMDKLNQQKQENPKQNSQQNIQELNNQILNFVFSPTLIANYKLKMYQLEAEKAQQGRKKLYDQLFKNIPSDLQNGQTPSFTIIEDNKKYITKEFINLAIINKLYEKENSFTGNLFTKLNYNLYSLFTFGSFSSQNIRRTNNIKIIKLFLYSNKDYEYFYDFIFKNIINHPNSFLNEEEKIKMVENMFNFNDLLIAPSIYSLKFGQINHLNKTIDKITEQGDWNQLNSILISKEFEKFYDQNKERSAENDINLLKNKKYFGPKGIFFTKGPIIDFIESTKKKKKLMIFYTANELIGLRLRFRLEIINEIATLLPNNTIILSAIQISSNCKKYDLKK